MRTQRGAALLWILTLAVAGLVLLWRYLAIPAVKVLSGHDTPIVVQGGSLWVFSQAGFVANSVYPLEIEKAGEYVDTITVGSLANFSSAGNPAYTIPNALKAQWTLCAQSPHYVQIQGDNTTSDIALTSWNPIDPAGNLPVFWGFTVNGTANTAFANGKLHVNLSALNHLVYLPGATACTAAVPSNCSASLSAACTIPCPAGSGCFIRLNY